MGHPIKTLYYGDNLDILRQYIEDKSVDLIYLDPSFNSKAGYSLPEALRDVQTDGGETAIEDRAD